jgi:Pentapeptide repeats (8 copies)
MLNDCWAWLAEISENEILRSRLLVLVLAAVVVVVLVLLERGWKKIPKKNRILQFLIAVLVITVVIPKPLVWPQGWGIGPEKSTNSVSVETVEKDAQGKLTKTVTTTKHDDGKTLWDWLSVLGVPLSLAILGFWLQTLQQSRAEALAKEEVLQGYFDRLSVLLVDKNLRAIAAKGNQAPDEEQLLDSSKGVIRARTLSILRRFENDPERKTSVMKFLIEAGFFSKLGLDLSYTDLRNVDLTGAALFQARLKGAKLNDAYLGMAHLVEADLKSANLSGANLSDASLSGSITDANLLDANLTNAKNLTREQLEKAKLCNTTLPKTITLNPNGDCKALGISEN